MKARDIGSLITEPTKWRAFKDTQEFLGTLHVTLLDRVAWKTKTGEWKGVSILTGITEYSDGKVEVTLGDKRVDLETLFSDYEWSNHAGQWKPFGIEKKE